MTQKELQKILGDRIKKLCDERLPKDEVANEIAISNALSKLAYQSIQSAKLVASMKANIGEMDSEFVNSITG